MKRRESDKKSILSERELVDLLRTVTGDPGERICLALGDDAAILRPVGDRDIVFTIDSFARGIHFEPAWGDSSKIGYRAMAGALSDIAAMGAQPVAAVVSLGIPEIPDVSKIRSLYEGIKRCAAQFGCGISGGETIRTNSDFVITIAICGDIDKGSALTRRGALPDNYLYVSGKLGSCRAAIRCLQTGCGSRALVERMRTVFFEPHPRIPEAEFLRVNLNVTAMIDISDGLSTDLHNLATESGVGAVIYENALPVSDDSREVSRLLGENVLDYVLNGGEEYELLFTVKEEVDVSVQSNFTERFGLDLSLIGRVLDSGFFIENADSLRHPLLPGGYDHLKRRSG